MKELENTIIAFSDWLDENADGYVMIVTKNGQSMAVAKGKHDELTKTVVNGMLQDPALKKLFMDAAGDILLREATDKFLGFKK